MKRSITAASIAIAFASTITVAIAQSPDFSPLPPRTVNGVEMDTQSSQAEAAPAVEPGSPTGRYLGETTAPAPSAQPPSSMTLIDPSPSRDAAVDPLAGSTQQPMPTHSIIGHGLFNKSGPDDFGQYPAVNVIALRGVYMPRRPPRRSQ